MIGALEAIDLKFNAANIGTVAGRGEEIECRI